MEYITGFAGGIAGLLFIKYVVIGLHYWNVMFHPGRIEPEHLNAFKRPLLLSWLNG